MSAGPTPNLAGGLTADGSSYPRVFWASGDSNLPGNNCSQPGSPCNPYGSASSGNGNGGGGSGSGSAGNGPSIKHSFQDSPLTPAGPGMPGYCPICQSNPGQTPAPIPEGTDFYNYVCVADGYLLPNLPITCFNTGETQQSSCSVTTFYLGSALEYGGLATFSTSGGVASLCGTMYPPATWVAASATTGGTGVTVTIETHTA